MPSAQPSTPADHCGCKVTGGGFLTLGTGHGHNKVTFGFVAMEKNGSAKGSIELVDHVTKTKFHGKVTAIDCHDNTATFSGTLKTGEAFSVTVVDNGEPGVNDTLSFSVAGSVKFSGDLGGTLHGGGNIQLHVDHDCSGSDADDAAKCVAELLKVHVKCDANLEVDAEDAD